MSDTYQMIFSNIFGSSRFLKDPYNYQSNLIGNVRMKELQNIMEMALQLCPECKLRKKNHYCIDLTCNHRELICPQCDTNRIDRKHYLHDYSYIVPFLTKDIFGNFYKIKKKITNFHEEVQVQIRKIEEYLKELYRVDEMVKNQIRLLELEEENGKIKGYVEKMSGFISKFEFGKKMKEELDGVMFLSAQQCQKKEDIMKNQIFSCLETLKWPRDPQKVLKQKLKSNPQDQKKEIFISRAKSIEVNEIDSMFKTNSEFLTEQLQRHQVQIKLDSDLMGKPKFYESFIYHFRDCQKLFIDNGNMNHLRTPLTFRNLKVLEFNFNLEAQPQNIKMEVCTEQLKELTLRRFREQDLKFLRQILVPCLDLKTLHIQFSNKIDLYCYKELLELLRQDNLKNLVNLTLKIRTENEVKRLYGYLSKFTKEHNDSEVNLNKQLIALIESNPHLTKVIIQGIKPLQMPIIVSKLKKLPFLMEYRLFYQNIDLMTEVQEREAKYLQMICSRRRRMFYALAKGSKNKYFSKGIISHLISGYLK